METLGPDENVLEYANGELNHIMLCPASRRWWLLPSEDSRSFFPPSFLLLIEVGLREPSGRESTTRS